MNSVNYERVLIYWKIGERIINKEQKVTQRAEYGWGILKKLSEQLQLE